MQKRKLGRTEIEVNPLGLGCMRISPPFNWLDGGIIDFNAPDEAESIKLLHKAVDSGIDLFDTAIAYGAGQNEETLGKAFSRMRDKVVIVTKFGHRIDETTRTLMLTKKSQSPARYRKSNTFPAMIKWQCEQSLRRLKTDYLDVYLCHVNIADNGEEMRESLEDLVKEGKIRSYGWSTDIAGNAEIMSKGKHCDVIELALNVMKPENEALEVCEKNSLAALIRSPLGGGILGKETDSLKDADKIKQMNAIKEILRSEGRTVVQGALAWLWAKSDKTIPIPGFRSMEQLDGLLGALEYGPLSSNQMGEIEKIQKKSE